MACSAPRTCWTIWSSPSPVNTGWVIEWLATRGPAAAICATACGLFAAQFPVRKKVPGTPRAARADRIFGSPAALAPASKVRATTRPAPGISVRSWPRRDSGSGTGRGGSGGWSGASGGPGSGTGGAGTGGSVTGGWTGAWPASGVSVSCSSCAGAEPPGAGGLGDPGGAGGSAGEGDEAADGGPAVGPGSHRARMMARTARAAASAIAAARRRTSPAGTTITCLGCQPSLPPMFRSGTFGAAGSGLRSVDYQHRAMRVCHDGGADRAQEQAAEPAVPPPAHHAHVGLAAGVDQRFAGMAADQGRRDVGRCLASEGLFHCVVEDFPGTLLEALDAHHHVAAVHLRVFPAGEGLDLGAEGHGHPLGLSKCLHGRFRPVDAHNDTGYWCPGNAHVCSLIGPALSRPSCLRMRAGARAEGHGATGGGTAGGRAGGRGAAGQPGSVAPWSSRKGGYSSRIRAVYTR